MWAPHVFQRSEGGRKRAVPSSSFLSWGNTRLPPLLSLLGVRVKVAATKIDRKRRRDKPLNEGRKRITTEYYSRIIGGKKTVFFEGQFSYRRFYRTTFVRITRHLSMGVNLRKKPEFCFDFLNRFVFQGCLFLFAGNSFKFPFHVIATTKINMFRKFVLLSFVGNECAFFSGAKKGADMLSKWNSTPEGFRTKGDPAHTPVFHKNIPLPLLF